MIDHRSILKGQYKKIELTAAWESMSDSKITFKLSELTIIKELDDQILFIFDCHNPKTNSYNGIVYDKTERSFTFMNYDHVKNEDYESAMTNYEDEQVLIIDTVNSTQDTIKMIEWEDATYVIDNYPKFVQHLTDMDDDHIMNNENVWNDDEMHYMLSIVPIKAMLMYCIETKNLAALRRLIIIAIENNLQTLGTIHETIDEIIKLDCHARFIIFAMSMDLIMEHHNDREQYQSWFDAPQENKE